MKSLIAFFLGCVSIVQVTRAQIPVTFPVWDARLEQQIPDDWLVKPCTQKAEIYRSADGKDVILYNGLLKRTFRVVPGVACTDFKNLSNGQQLLRALSPEARITVDGKTYLIGGLKGQSEKAYLLPEWLDGFT
ncbi:MAG TPA: hypothetical protein PK228_21735, partial [Saprospiraceae bacterium]|nr:hypothetical protein [Saprospiraceae bacterium]